MPPECEHSGGIFKIIRYQAIDHRRHAENKYDDLEVLYVL